MAEKRPLSSDIQIIINGTKLQNQVLAQVAAWTVEQDVHLPDMFTLRLFDPALKLLDKGTVDLTNEVEIKAENSKGSLISIFEGEVTALEPSFGDGMVSELFVRGYDPSHRLFREVKSRAFLNKKDSDLAQEIAQEAGLDTKVDSTQTVYDHIFQDNQTDLAFLMQRAWRIGYDCFVKEKTLHFTKPDTAGASVTLTWGDDLLSFYPRVTLSEQVDEVSVRGWDAETLKPIVGKAQSGQRYPEIEESKDGATWASDFGNGKFTIVNQPVVSQAEADLMAAARMDELSGTFIQAHGTAFRRPDIRAGQKVKLESLGKRLSGTYLITNATHEYGADGLHTRFKVQGARASLLSEQLGQHKPASQWNGVVTGVVTNTEDPNKWGRVKLQFPWMTEDAESNWARVIGIGAGAEAGC